MGRALPLALLVAMLFVGQVQALTINGTFIGGPCPTNLPGGGTIEGGFNSAARVWEQIFHGPFVLDIDYGCRNGFGGEHTLLQWDGRRETAGLITVGNLSLYASKSPWTEYGTYTEYFDPTLRGLNVGRVFSDPSFDPQLFSLEDIFTHEFGHALGNSMANPFYVAEVADGDIDISPWLPYGGISLAVAMNFSGPTSHLHQDKFRETNSGAIEPGVSRALSVADALSVLQTGAWWELGSYDLYPAIPPAHIPEPGTVTLLTVGLILMISVRTLKKRARG